jgi:cathepsin E
MLISFFLFFVFDQVVFELNNNAQIWPRILNADIGGVASKIYLIVNNFGGTSINDTFGISAVVGMAFLERFYSVYDTANLRVGLAKTALTFATSN